MTELVSPCCGKPVRLMGAAGLPSNWYECSACGKPVDPVPAIAGPCDPVRAFDYGLLDDAMYKATLQFARDKDAKDEAHPSDAHVAEVQKSRNEWDKP